MGKNIHHLRGLVVKMYKELKKLDIISQSTLVKNFGTKLNREFSTDESLIAEKHKNVQLVINPWSSGKCKSKQL